MNQTVMIVDDATFMRNLLREILEMGGYTIVAEAANGVEAVALYWEHKPDLTLMDVIMPTKNGIEAAEEIIAFDKQAKIVMCSIVGHEELVKTARQIGARDVILKPFKPEQVLDVVHRIALS